MFDFQRTEHEVLGTAAISAPVAGLFADAPTNVGGYVRRGHDGSGPRRPRRTASCTAIAFRMSPS